MRQTSVSPFARKAPIPCLLLYAALLTGAATAQQASQPAPANSTYTIDLATALRLAGAQNLDVQLARNAVDEAHANYASAVERFTAAWSHSRFATASSCAAALACTIVGRPRISMKPSGPMNVPPSRPGYVAA